ncbi:hypothetical protein EVAR_20773_1 [Eumeta japonica]|uniref:Uncharacterized protein n=1 Tax=Eumeta variegata TaxID=151549 RepID=A0A4C1UDM6_EUMVA|nr:hypothetical protein EVAR_20773_1 [Eumeta japonica]
MLSQPEARTPRAAATSQREATAASAACGGSSRGAAACGPDRASVLPRGSPSGATSRFDIRRPPPAGYCSPEGSRCVTSRTDY